MPRSGVLARRELRFAQLLISKPELELRRDKRGRIFVAGLDIAEGERFLRDPKLIIGDIDVERIAQERCARVVVLAGAAGDTIIGADAAEATNLILADQIGRAHV